MAKKDPIARAMEVVSNTLLVQKMKAFEDAIEERLIDLYSRWQDEREYEDIKDYQLPLQPIAEKFGVTIKRMTASPFGLIWEIEGVRFQTRVNSTRMLTKCVGV